MLKNKGKMENITKKLHIKRAILICIILIWMGVVFFLSAENANESNETSSRVVNFIINIFEKLSVGSLDVQNVENLTFIIRKCAHFTLYLIGAIPVLLFLKTFNIGKKRIYIYTFLFCTIYACSDELHQLLSQGRNGNIIDVLIDSLGSIFGIIILEILSNVIGKFNKRSVKNECN